MCARIKGLLSPLPPRHCPGWFPFSILGLYSFFLWAKLKTAFLSLLPSESTRRSDTHTHTAVQEKVKSDWDVTLLPPCFPPIRYVGQVSGTALVRCLPAGLMCSSSGGGR